jgi:two-component system cell cycle sensor histidine kinase/response regulator CckA
MLARLEPIPFGNSSSVAAPAPALPLAVVGQASVGQGTDAGWSTFFEAQPLPMWVFDLETLRFLAVNDAAIHRYGWSRTEFLTLTAERVRPTTCLTAFRQFCSQIRVGASGLNNDPELLHLTKDGTVFPVSVAWQGLKYLGRPAMCATILDCSEQRRAEEENRELVEVLNLASDAIVVCDLERQIQFWNEGAVKLYGWTSAEVMGKKVHEVFKIETDLILTSMTGLLEKGAWNSQMKHIRKDGTPAIVNSSWTLTRDSTTKQPKCILLIGSDITETKKLESQFLRAQRLESLGTLASGIAHDLNNILSPILMASGILRQGGLDAEDMKMLSIIEGSAERGAGIVKQVLTFARGAEGERVLLQPKHIVTDMAKVMVQTFPKNLDIQTNIPNDLWMVSGDATQIHQVLLNLCVNARDAMGEKGGRLRVVCTNTQVDAGMAATNPGAQVGPHVCISVTDTGMGMTTEVMEKIFDPFFTTKEQGKGTGLGLATVIGIVHGHKGFITLQSQVGVGTTFRVFIPANVEAKSEAKAYADLDALRGDGETILVVDDESSVREAVVAQLEAFGYQCYTAEDGTDALALYFERQDQIAGIITDLHMGIMDGITLVRSLRRLVPDVKVIVSSGHLEKEKVEILKGLGVDLLLEKPYSVEKLLTTVRKMLETECIMELRR